MSILRASALFGAAVLASGCVSLSRSEAVSPLDASVAQEGRITEILLDKGEIRVTPEFDAIFRQRVQSKLDGCARGPRPLRLEARIERLSKANPLLTAAVAGANVLRGTARLVDLGTGEAVGEYRIGQTVVGGRIAVIRMAQAEEQMSDGFGQELCRQAFAPRRPASLTGKPASQTPEPAPAAPQPEPSPEEPASSGEQPTPAAPAVEPPPVQAPAVPAPAPG
ncbi:MAG: hypothetical protein KY446_01260 [Proteobacteria bacterium]|nr:hypothetical protein [Pseudomonadota bacterium]